MSVATKPHPPSPNYHIYTDGGSRGNPGPAAAAFVIFDSQKKLVHTGGDYLGSETNNVAEYQGVLLALKYILTISHIPTPTSFYLDSKLVVEQLSGRFKIKNPHLQELAAEVNLLVKNNNLLISFAHIPREQNSLADAQVNRILDAQATSC